MNNPMNFLQQIMNNRMAQQNPMMKNAMDMYQRNDENGLRQLAENLCKERGTSIDEVRKRLGF